MEPEAIIEAVCREFEITPEVLAGPDRTARVSSARSIAAALLCDNLNLTFRHVGEILKRDRSTIHTAVKTTRAKAKAQPNFAVTMSNIFSDARDALLPPKGREAKHARRAREFFRLLRELPHLSWERKVELLEIEFDAVASDAVREFATATPGQTAH